MRDLILSSLYNLKAGDLIPFLESLENTGYCGRKVMVCYDVDNERDGYLAACGWEVAHSTPDVHHPFTQRWIHYAEILRQIPDVFYVLICDCRDIVFQRNPSRYLAENCSPLRYLLASEAITLRDEPWAAEFTAANYPDEWPWLQDMPSYCAGTVAGGRDPILELCGNVARFSLTGKHPREKPNDQPAFNLLANQPTTSGCATPATLDTAFAATCGTILNPDFADVLTEPAPVIDGPILRESGGRTFCLLHQYDRYPDFCQQVLAHHVRPPIAEPLKTGVYDGPPDFPDFPPDVLHDAIRGKHVALVGPSPSIGEMGAAIDDADVVVRMNRALISEEDPAQVGTRTDILYHCLHEDPQCGGPIPWGPLAAGDTLFCSPYPRGMIPFHHDACAFLARNRAYHLRYHFIDRDFYRDLAVRLGTRPNTGIAAICDLLAHRPASLTVYGFTFFADGFRPAYKVLPPGTLDTWRAEEFSGNHHQEPQRALVHDLFRTFRNLKLDGPVAAALDLAPASPAL